MFYIVSSWHNQKKPLESQFFVNGKLKELQMLLMQEAHAFFS